MILPQNESNPTHTAKSLTPHSLGKLQCDDSLGLCFYGLSPKFEFGVDGAMKDEILFEALGMKGTDWRVMAHLLWHPPKAQVVSGGEQRHGGYCRKAHYKRQIFTKCILRCVYVCSRHAWEGCVQSHLMSSKVSPSSGLKGFPVLSHCDATADTANAATHYAAVV